MKRIYLCIAFSIVLLNSNARTFYALPKNETYICKYIPYGEQFNKQQVESWYDFIVKNDSLYEENKGLQLRLNINKSFESQTKRGKEVLSNFIYEKCQYYGIGLSTCKYLTLNDFGFKISFIDSKNNLIPGHFYFFPIPILNPDGEGIIYNYYFVYRLDNLIDKEKEKECKIRILYSDGRIQILNYWIKS